MNQAEQGSDEQVNEIRTAQEAAVMFQRVLEDLDAALKGQFTADGLLGVQACVHRVGLLSVWLNRQIEREHGNVR